MVLGRSLPKTDSSFIDNFGEEQSAFATIAEPAITPRYHLLSRLLRSLGLISAFAPHFRQQFHLSATQMAFLIALPILPGSLKRIPMGMLTDRFGVDRTQTHFARRRIPLPVEGTAAGWRIPERALELGPVADFQTEVNAWKEVECRHLATNPDDPKAQITTSEHCWSDRRLRNCRTCGTPPASRTSVTSKTTSNRDGVCIRYRQ